MFAQQSLQHKLSRRCYASVSYALQNNSLQTRTELSQCRWWVMNTQWEWIPECWTRNITVTHVYDDAARWSIYQTVQYFIWSKNGVMNFVTVKYPCITLVKPYYTKNSDSPVIHHWHVMTTLCVLQRTEFLQSSEIHTSNVQYFISSKNCVLNLHKCSEIKLC